MVNDSLSNKHHHNHHHHHKKTDDDEVNDANEMEILPIPEVIEFNEVISYSKKEIHSNSDSAKLVEDYSTNHVENIGENHFNNFETQKFEDNSLSKDSGNQKVEISFSSSKISQINENDTLVNNEEPNDKLQENIESLFEDIQFTCENQTQVATNNEVTPMKTTVTSNTEGNTFRIVQEITIPFPTMTQSCCEKNITEEDDHTLIVVPHPDPEVHKDQSKRNTSMVKFYGDSKDFLANLFSEWYSKNYIKEGISDKTDLLIAEEY